MARTKVNAEIKWPDIVGDVRVDLAKVYNKIDDSAGPNQCWSWSGPRHRQGYGMCGGQRIDTGKKIMMTIHRLLLKEKLGYNPGDTVDAVHTCGNMRCVNPDHIVAGNASMIFKLHYKRTGRYPGRLHGVRLNKPRQQNYRYGIDNIKQLATGQITSQEFARRTGMTATQASRIKWNIDNDVSYYWAKPRTE